MSSLGKSKIGRARGIPRMLAWMIKGRALSTSTSVQIPLRLYNLEGRYATALYGAASKKRNLSLVESELNKIKIAIKKSPQLQTFLHDPLLKREQKRENVLAMLRDQNYCETTMNLFNAIADNGRLPSTMKIIEGFEDIMRAHRRELSVKIVSAIQLSSEQVEMLTSIVKKSLISNGQQQSPKVTVSVDPKILGGIIVEIGDKTVDLSVATRLAAINKALEDSIYQ